MVAPCPNVDALIQLLRGNEPRLTEIDLRNIGVRAPNATGSDQNCFRELLAALRDNHTATSVNLIFRFLQSISEEDLFELFEAVGSLPNLEQFRLASSGLARLPLRLTNAALQKTRNLKSLTLQSIHAKENVIYKTKSLRNTNDEEFLSFLDILGKNLKESLESFAIQDLEDSFDLDALVDVLITLPNLKDLSIRSFSPMNQRLTRNSVAQLFASKSISSLALRRLRLGSILPELLVSLEDNCTLKKLSLEQNGLDFQCGMAIAYLLLVNQKLEILNLGYNMIPDDCGSAIIGALSGNKTLTSLDLTANGLELYTCRRLAHLLASNESTLQQLTLNQNSLCDEGVIMIAAGLAQNSTLRDLSLAETQITDTSCTVLMASLQTNDTLERLNLADNQVKDEGCISLSTALRVNSTVKSLNLFGNNLRDHSVLELADMLKENSTLERLNLGNNSHLTPTAYKALEQVLLDDNVTLKHLWLPPTVDIVMPECSIPSFLRLNRLGRAALLQELDSAKMWLETMQASASDIHQLYYLLRANPTVVSWLQQ